MVALLAASILALVPGLHRSFAIDRSATAQRLMVPLLLPAASTLQAAHNPWQTIQVASGQTLGSVFASLGLRSADMHRLLASPDARPLHRLRAGAELTFEIDDDNDPIEVAGMTTYSIRINNIGTRPDAQVRLVVEAPEGAAIEQVNSPMKYEVNGRQVIFAPIPSLASKQQVVVKVGVKHTREGTQVLRASLQSQLRAVPVIKDESTQVYRDQ